MSCRTISIHAPREGSDLGRCAALRYLRDFNPRSPRRERPQAVGRAAVRLAISIHAPREGSDRRGRTLPTLRPYFNPRSPRRERRVCGVLGGGVLDFNPRSPRRERPASSIAAKTMLIFQSTLPAKGATAHWKTLGYQVKFQSTLPAKGATSGRGWTPASASDFNPRSPRRERRARPLFMIGVDYISIHAPREGSDKRLAYFAHGLLISIHAPREGSDHGRRRCFEVDSQFQSTLPAKGATINPVYAHIRLIFQSTLPAKGATRTAAFFGASQVISIHAPREGSDAAKPSKSPSMMYFNPRSPRRERPRLR